MSSKTNIKTKATSKAKRVSPRKRRKINAEDNLLQTSEVKKRSLNKGENKSALPTYDNGETFDVPIEKVKIFEKNARSRKNSEYENIKHSILTRGFRGSFGVTLIPNEDRYTLTAGEGTRFSIVKEIHNESNGKLFKTIPVYFNKYTDEETMVFDHWAENKLRSDIPFCDTAEEVVYQVSLQEKKLNKKLSHRKAVDVLNELGYSGISKSTLGNMYYFIEFLKPCIPNLALDHQGEDLKIRGMGGHMMGEIRALFNSSLKTYLNSSVSHEQEDWEKLFYGVLKTFDKKDKLDLGEFKNALVKKINKSEPDIAEAMEDEFSSKKRLDSTSDATKVVSDANISENKETLTGDLKDALVSTNDDPQYNNKSTKKITKEEFRNSIYENVLKLIKDTHIEKCLKQESTGIGYSLTLPPNATTEQEASLWWILHTLDTSNPLFMIDDYKTWQSESNNVITLKVMTSALNVFIRNTRKEKLTLLHKIELEILELSILNK